jgi:hypothetical protein
VRLPVVRGETGQEELASRSPSLLDLLVVAQSLDVAGVLGVGEIVRRPRYLVAEPMRSRIGRDGLAACGAAAAIALAWYGGWIALESVSVASALALTAASLWLLRQDRIADYLRSLVPWLVIRVGSYDASYQYIPLELSALGNGVAYNVMVNLFPRHPAGDAIIAEGDAHQLAPGEHKVVRIAMVHNPFLGRLEVGYFDPTGRRHVAWHTVNCASGYLSTTDALNWDCPPGCIVHPASRVRF